MDEFGPLNLQPHAGRQWAPAAAGTGSQVKPRRRRRRATYKRPHGVRHLLAGNDLSTDRLYGHIVPRKGRTEFLALCRYLRSLVVSVLRNITDGETEWQRAMVLFGGVEAVAFAPLWWLFLRHTGSTQQGR